MWRLAREADDDSERLAGQVPGRWRSRSSEGLGLVLAGHAKIAGGSEKHLPQGEEPYGLTGTVGAASARAMRRRCVGTCRCRSTGSRTDAKEHCLVGGARITGGRWEGASKAFDEPRGANGANDDGRDDC